MEHIGGAQKILQKSSAWARHGKHRQVDPFYYRNERRPRRRLEPMYATAAEAFQAARRDRRRYGRGIFVNHGLAQ